MSILQKVCCFFLFGKMLLYLCPDKKYEAYYSLLLQWTMFAIIVLPILAGGTGKQKLQEAQDMWESWQQEMEEVRQEKMSREAEKKMQEAVRQYAEQYGEEMRDDAKSTPDETRQNEVALEDVQEKSRREVPQEEKLWDETDRGDEMNQRDETAQENESDRVREKPVRESGVNLP